MRAVSLLLVAIAGLALLPASAAAQSCASLIEMHRMASRSGGGGMSAERVASRLAQVQSIAVQQGCGGMLGGLFGGGQCRQINAEIRALRSELAQAQARASGGGGNGFNLAAIEQRLVRNGCVQPQPRAQRTARAKPEGRGTARTLCVRLCDGYYFPVSAASRRDRHKVDAEVCQSVYAGAGQAELFLQRPDGDVAMAVSLDGKSRYADKPYAFLFRKSFQPLCQSQLKTGIAALAARYEEALGKLPPKEKSAARARRSPETAPFPRMRPAAIGEDPETLAARRGSLVFDEYAPPAVAEALGIRFVGESYYAELHDPARPEPPAPAYRPPLGFDLIASAKAHAALAAMADVATQ
jgi:hypothetical protein